MKDIRKVIGLLLCMTICCYMTGKEKKNLNIVFIGNSITQGALLENPRHEAPPVKAALYLRRQPSVGTVRYSNQGVSGSTTFDFLPQTDLLFPKVVRVADQFKDETWATLIFSIMLGTNDSAITGPNGAPASPAKYYENMKTIIDKLLALYPECKIVLHRPVWYSPNTYNGAKYLEEGLNRLQSYYPELQALVLDYSNQLTNGEIWFQGKKINEEPVDKRAKAGMFLSFQSPLEVPGLSLSSFIRSALEQRRGERIRLWDFRKELAKAMELLQMDPSYADRDLNVGFSGGEKKKAEILQMLMLKPNLAILDETDSGLDVDAVRTVSKGVEEYQKDRDGSLLIITHSTRILEALHVDYTHVMVDGKIVKTGDGSLVDQINETGFEEFLK